MTRYVPRRMRPAQVFPVDPPMVVLYPGGLGRWRAELERKQLRDEFMEMDVLPGRLRNAWRRLHDHTDARKWIAEFMDAYDMPEHIREAFGMPRKDRRDPIAWPVVPEEWSFIALSPLIASLDGGQTWHPVPETISFRDYEAASTEEVYRIMQQERRQ